APERQEAALGQPPVQRHLSALESGTHAAPGAGLLALVPLPRRLAVTRAGAAADALPLLRRARRGPEVLDPHAASTLRANVTALIIPWMVGVSSCSTVCRMWRSPSARTVASCLGLSPMMLFTSVTLSFLATGRLLPVTVQPAPAGRMQIELPLHAPERVDGRLEHVVRVVRPQRLGEHVLDARRLQHRPDRAARDDPGALRGRLHEDARGPELPGHLARDGGVLEGHEDQILLGVLHRLPDRFRNLARLAEPHAHMTAPVSHHHQGGEGEASATLD